MVFPRNSSFPSLFLSIPTIPTWTVRKTQVTLIIILKVAKFLDLLVAVPRIVS